MCAAVTGSFFLLNCGYFAPYGGLSPGPRFLIPCLPFLALGLAPAFERSFRATAVLGALSVVALTAVTLTWVSLQPTAGTTWSHILDVPVHLGSAAIPRHLTSNVIVLLGATRSAGAVLVVVAAASAVVVSLEAARSRTKGSATPVSRRPAHR